MSAILKTKPLHGFSAGREVSASAGSVGDVSSLIAESLPVALVGDRLLAFQALQLLMRLDRELLEARAQWNQDWFRRLMRIRPRAVRRLTRRWERLTPTPSIRLGTLRRRYHANLARYLYDTRP
ncbi:MAG: hypothetical protein M3410_15990 [Acidobacteriota bacterium]|nr:hypothetical protein [Acidobacteriota bacterium]